MLYVTTRTNKDAFTAYRAINENIAPDGGRFVPFRIPVLSAREIAELCSKNFGEIVADILNKFFSSRLTGWDVDFCIGRNAVRLFSMSHRIIIAELWHNPNADYEYVVKNLQNMLLNTECADHIPSEWTRIAIRIAVLFGLFCQLPEGALSDLDQVVDISVPADDFTMPMAAWYARRMGLPIGMIICTCEDNSAVWDLIHRGVFNTAAADHDLQLGIERLIQANLGYNEVCLYREKCDKGQVYSVSEDKLAILSDGIFCAVVGSTRAGSIINSVFRSNSYVVDPVTALSYGGLQDYRSRTGGSRTTLLVAENTPLAFSKEISASTGIPANQLTDHVNYS